MQALRVNMVCPVRPEPTMDGTMPAWSLFGRAGPRPAAPLGPGLWPCPAPRIPWAAGGSRPPPSYIGRPQHPATPGRDGR